MENDYYPFQQYIKNIEEMKDQNPHERNFQERISDFIKKMLINTDIQVIDVSLDKNTDIHDRNHYTGEKGTPDILITNNYEYKNIKKFNGENIAVVEVKIPKAQWNEKKLIEENKLQLISHLSVNEKVIFTDCIKWCFFNNMGFDKLTPVKSFNLQDSPNEWKKKESKMDDFVRDLLELDSNFLETDPDEWVELNNYVKEFVGVN